MAQEFTINSTAIESKINQLLPSQGGFGAGVDFSASTMVIPIVDLTETAEGSDVRSDIQTAFSHNSITSFYANNSTATAITTTGYYRVYGNFIGSTGTGSLNISDGATTKAIVSFFGSGSTFTRQNFDFIVFLQAGDSFLVTSSASTVTVGGSTRQIADISGNLVNP